MSAEDKRDIEITRKDLYCQRPEIKYGLEIQTSILNKILQKENV